MKIKLSAAVLALTILFSLGCSKQAAKAPVPGAVDSFDATNYRALKDAQASLHRAKTQYECTNQNWPATVTVEGASETCDKSKGIYPLAYKEPLNKAIAAYNTAEASWQAYHSGKSQDATGLSKAISELSLDINNLISMIGGAK